MQTITLETPSSGRRELRTRIAEHRAFAAATGVALLHALDDAFLHRQPGLDLSQHALAGLLSVAGAVAAVAAFGRVRPALRAVIAFVLGTLAVVNGSMHVQHVSTDGVARSDFTGVLAFVAGLVLAGLAAAILWRHRRPGSLRVWTQRALGTGAASVGAVLVLGPASMGIVDVHKWREPVGAAPGPDYRDVAFRAGDGLRLTGWYRPTENGATVLLVHGGGSDRQGSVAHAKVLARHGYGVLLYDARGRGHSEGSPVGYGFDWRHDVTGALDFLESRPEVDPGRIGALGLSTGADALVETTAPTCARSSPTGRAAMSYEDWHRLRGDELGMVPGYVMFKTIEVLSGDPPPPPLEDRVRALRRPLLLISAGTAEEYEFSALYDRAGGPNVEHWNLPEVGHTAAIREAPEAYEARVTAFFDRELR